MSSKRIKKTTMMKMMLAVVMVGYLGISGMVGCGMAESTPQINLRLQSLSAETFKSIKFLDLAIFRGDKIACEAISDKNYESKEALLQEARVGLVYATLTEQKTLLRDLPAGSNLIVFVLALQSTADNNKKAVAKGCKTGVTLEEGKMTPLEIKMLDL